MLQGFFTNKLMFFEKLILLLEESLSSRLYHDVCKSVTEEEHADAEQPGVVDERAGSEADAAHR